MLGTLNLTPAGISPRFGTENHSLFSPGKFKSDQKKNMSFVLHAAVAEAAPEVERRRKQSDSLYEVLEVKQNASPREIKTAYRTLAKIYHPDVFAAQATVMLAALDGNDSNEFIEIHEAYATLSDPSARERYDTTLRGRRMMRYSSPVVRARTESYSGARTEAYSGRRWESDQCW